ncbi:DUF669 domain-containing protein [Ochrobactrum sp. BTU1]|uniref:DUF669 domain-containing protein n=1 Tax=Ochrobactrum sp. BTU1 TaxID=2840456 RepID=UPI001C03F6C2|nr:DUF669 domain-containing protein [Ochrobactrum sp. BTU1]
MAQLGTKFDATSVDTAPQDFSTLPLGTYRLEVTASEVAATKAGTGTILKLTYDVVEPEPYVGRKIFANINIQNANPTAQEIGQRELGSLCRAIGISELEDSEELHFVAFTAKVGLEKPQEGYAQRNKIVRFYYPDENNVPEPSIDAQQPAAAAQRPANDNRPAAANTNKPAQPAKAAGSRPWSK